MGYQTSTRTTQHQKQYMYKDKVGTIDQLSDMFGVPKSTLYTRAKPVASRMGHETDDFMNVVRENIREEIQKQGTSARSISLGMKRHTGFVTDYLNGKTNMRFNNLVSLLEALGYTTEDMYLMFMKPEVKKELNY